MTGVLMGSSQAERSARLIMAIATTELAMLLRRYGMGRGAIIEIEFKMNAAIRKGVALNAYASPSGQKTVRPAKAGVSSGSQSPR